MVTLVQQPDDLSNYYGALLGNSVDFVRKFAAKAFVIITRKLPTSVFKQHIKKLLKAVSGNVRSALRDDLSLLLFDDYDAIFNEEREKERFQSEIDGIDESEKKEKARSNAGVRRTKWLLDGLSLLFFYSCKGIRGLAHSKANKRVQSMYSILLSSAETEIEVDTEVDTEVMARSGQAGKKGKELKTSDSQQKKKKQTVIDVQFAVKCQATILFRCQSRLHKHLFYQHQSEILSIDLQFIKDLLSITNKLNQEYGGETFILFSY
jgi:hypothetical protein